MNEILIKIYNAHVNASLRNCNLSALGITVSRADNLQLQFLSALACAYNRYEIFNNDQLLNLKNILDSVILISNIDNIITLNVDINNLKTNPMINIPKGKEELFDRVFKLFADYGLDEIKQCQTCCKSYSQTSLQLFNMLQSASVLNINIGDSSKEADLIYKYVDSILNKIYK